MSLFYGRINERKMKVISFNFIKSLFIKWSSKVGIVSLIFNKLLFEKYRKVALFLLARYVNYVLAFIIIFLASIIHLEFKLFIFTLVLFILTIIICRNFMNKFNFLLNIVASLILIYLLILNFVKILF
jgi:hypothetical protein